MTSKEDLSMFVLSGCLLLVALFVGFVFGCFVDDSAWRQCLCEKGHAYHEIDKISGKTTWKLIEMPTEETNK